jgi:hypothetical protein
MKAARRGQKACEMPTFDPGVCAMKPTCHQTHKATNRSVVPLVCPWRATESIDGVPLCWVHWRSVLDGMRRLPVVPGRKVAT